MKIELTKEQYKNLIKLVCLGNIMANSFREGDERIGKFDRMEGQVLSEAARFGLGDHARKCDCRDCGGRLAPSDRLIDDPDVVLAQTEYDEDVFWDEIIERLAERDFRLHYGRKAIDRMTPEERVEKEEAYHRRYEDETDEHGVDRLVVGKE